ncbi:MAG: CoA transferase, partial [Dehalococcoidales bacterium]|nr:CoA transferase [Dehalococcoidales bacterium]
IDMEQKYEGMLSQYRVLDLTDEKGWLCGKMLGDLGADVIKIEPPAGDPGRNIGPFYHDEPDPEKSLYWFAFNTSKRGITLNIESSDGREIFNRLVSKADFVIESFSPGYLDKLRLGYSSLEKINAGIIMVSITAFGQTGPYKDYKAPDIVVWAMGGKMYTHGDSEHLERPPIRISHPSQAYLHAASDGAVGAVMALLCRHRTGEGQQVDVSAQECVERLADQQINHPWDTQRRLMSRKERNAPITYMWPCKDGYVIFNLYGGMVGERNNSRLIALMDSKGKCPDFLKNYDWLSLDVKTAPKEIIDRIETPIGKFFLEYTKEELYKEVLEYHTLLYPVNNIADIFPDLQLKSREYWTQVEHPELGVPLTYQKSFTHATETPPKTGRRAPLIGEHNFEIYEKEMGYTRKQLSTLKEANVI